MDARINSKLLRLCRAAECNPAPTGQTADPLNSLGNATLAVATLLISWCFSSQVNFCRAGSVRTANFIVEAPSQAFATEVAKFAEQYRKELATYWLGTPLPTWPNPCPIRVIVGPNLPAQGVTTYDPIPARDFQMEVVGSKTRILDSVLPHEITHAVLATYFGRPLPRWADEGICTTVEHQSERQKHERKLIEFLRSHRGIAMNQLFLMKDYPADVLPMYAQGYSVCQFLIAQRGPRAFIQFLGDYLHHPSWTTNIKRHYGYDSLQEFQDFWIAWVASGSGPTNQFAKWNAPTTTDNLIAVSYSQRRKPAESIATTPPTTENNSPSRSSARSTNLSLGQEIKQVSAAQAFPASRNAPMTRTAVDAISLPERGQLTNSPTDAPSLASHPNLTSDPFTPGWITRPTIRQPSTSNQQTIHDNLHPMTILVPVSPIEGVKTLDQDRPEAPQTSVNAAPNSASVLLQPRKTIPATDYARQTWR